MSWIILVTEVEARATVKAEQELSDYIVELLHVTLRLRRVYFVGNAVTTVPTSFYPSGLH